MTHPVRDRAWPDYARQMYERNQRGVAMLRPEWLDRWRDA